MFKILDEPFFHHNLFISAPIRNIIDSFLRKDYCIYNHHSLLFQHNSNIYLLKQTKIMK